MRIVVLVPSAEYRNYAGARIRYQRILPHLEAAGIELELHDISKFAPHTADADVLIVSKCHDARALVAAAIFAGRGKLVGVDLFDDYFSQVEDSRMVRFRNWLAQMLSSCNFALCSTDQMATVIHAYRADFPVHVMNDPASELRIDELPDLLTRKFNDARDTRRLIVGWYGVGDNPYFPIGLRDLAAFGKSLAELARNDMDVELRVLTNRRALNATGLSYLQQLPVRAVQQEWSEEAEQALLAEAFVAFLPVSSQPFSTAKSLNRAITALTAGCQVLSVGFPLYRKLNGLIYRDSGSLLADFEKGALRLSPQNIEQYRKTIESFASADLEATELAQFLIRIQAGEPANDLLVIVHGFESNGIAHQLVQSAHGLSVASPFCRADMGFDVIFNGSIDSMGMFVSLNAASRLAPSIQQNLGAASIFFGRKYLEIVEHRSSGRAVLPSPVRWDEAALPFQLATYAHSMRQVRSRIDEAFGRCRIMVSESSPLPFSFAN